MQHFVLEGPVWTNSVGARPIVGCCWSISAAMSFLEGSVLTASVWARSDSQMLLWTRFGSIFFLKRAGLDSFGRARSGGWILLARFGSNFFLEGARLHSLSRRPLPGWMLPFTRFGSSFLWEGPRDPL